MFDGNHRSRRTINLSKSTRRNKANGLRNKASILQQSREAREKRMLESKRLNAAKLIQRNWRGFRLRRTYVRFLIGMLGFDSSGSWNNNAKFHVGFNSKSAPSILNIGGSLLTDSLVVFMEKSVKRKLLVKLSDQISEIHPLHYVIYKKIVVHSLKELQINDKEIPFSLTDRAAIIGLIDKVLSSEDLLKKLIPSCSHLNLKMNEIKMNEIELEMISCLKTCAWQAAKTSPTNGASSGTESVSSEAMALDLLKLSNLIAKHKHSTVLPKIKSVNTSVQEPFIACMAAVVLGIDIEVSKSLRWPRACDESNSAHEMKWYFDLFDHLKVALTLQQSRNAISASKFLSGPEYVAKIINGREVFLIKNAIEMLSASTSSDAVSKHSQKDSLNYELIDFIAGLLSGHDQVNSNTASIQSKQLRALVALVGLAAKGVNIEKIHIDSLEVIALTLQDDGDDENSDDDGDVIMIEQAPAGPTLSEASSRNTKVKKTFGGSSTKLRRQDLQTIPKLDQVYKINLNNLQKEVVTWLRGCEHNTLHTMFKIAMEIVSGDLITRLVATAVQHQTSTETEAFSKRLVQQNLVRILFLALQNCTGAKARDCAMSPLLSKLAFNSMFMESLWSHSKFHLQRMKYPNQEGKYAGERLQAYSAIALFSDLFSHQLMALDDEELLSTFTAKNKDGKARSSILVVDIIDQLRELLYDLYWAKPVVVSDYDIPSASNISKSDEDLERHYRGRLLLSGTKLWNALYERWSRLYRTAQFCGEEIWWFPHLVTRDQDENGAVDGRIAAMNQVEMDMNDDDNSIESTGMNIDQNINNEAEGENDALASSFKDPKMARILTSIPQALPFDRRARLFSSLLVTDISKTQDETEAMRNMMWSMQRGEEGAEYGGSERVKIRRDHLYEDSMDQLGKLGRKLRKRVQVTFVSQHTGTAEAGIDGGGLFREFVDDLIKDAFSPEAKRSDIGGSLVSESPLQTLSINTRIEPSHLTLRHYQFLGRVLGKAVYESILVEPQFSLPFLNQLLGKHNTLDDLKNVDPEYYKHLSALRRMSIKEIDDLGITFELTTLAEEGKGSRTVELISGGRNIPVTKDNAVRYAYLVAHRRLNVETSAQLNAFLKGFRDLIPASWVRLFSPYELQKVISGDDTVKGIDVNGLKEVMLYSGGYNLSQPIMQWFWEVVDEMTPKQQRQLLKFVTSCSRQPLLGFRALVPLPCVQQIRLPEHEKNSDGAKLPTASTCMNLLKLPNYTSKQTLQTKLLISIEACAGFELS
mmetsp:Transcript_126/g.244  ORF Transcript_126/g.244 Transcript_126/m.244 type:complete len:1264 (-) Transcript_126:22-3813(-)